MMNLKILLSLLLLGSTITVTPIVTAANDDYGHEEDTYDEPAEATKDAPEHDEAGIVKLTSEQMKIAGVIVKPIQLLRI
ncbi:MAG: hypothetical protein Q9N32_07170 [Gammaproteobacteria bacterium]|nr:hypothetical protein [Gammaproteobacteria bacterium]